MTALPGPLLPWMTALHNWITALLQQSLVLDDNATTMAVAMFDARCTGMVVLQPWQPQSMQRRAAHMPVSLCACLFVFCTWLLMCRRHAVRPVAGRMCTGSGAGCCGARCGSCVFCAITSAGGAVTSVGGAITSAGGAVTWAAMSVEGLQGWWRPGPPVVMCTAWKCASHPTTHACANHCHVDCVIVFTLPTYIAASCTKVAITCSCRQLKTILH